MNSHEILTRGAAFFNVSVDKIRGHYRNPRVALPRHVIAAVIRKFVIQKGKPISYPQIGRFLLRDHTTIQNSCKQVNVRPELQQMYADLVAHLGLEPLDNWQAVGTVAAKIVADAAVRHG